MALFAQLKKSVFTNFQLTSPGTWGKALKRTSSAKIMTSSLVTKQGKSAEDYLCIFILLKINVLGTPVKVPRKQLTIFNPKVNLIYKSGCPTVFLSVCPFPLGLPRPKQGKQTFNGLITMLWDIYDFQITQSVQKLWRIFQTGQIGFNPNA